MNNNNPLLFKIGYLLGRVTRIIIFIYILKWFGRTPDKP